MHINLRQKHPGLAKHVNEKREKHAFIKELKRFKYIKAND
jgi:hypothetical protein